MTEDWRVVVTKVPEDRVQALTEQLAERLPDSSDVWNNRGRIEIYPDTEELAHAAQAVAEELVSSERATAQAVLERWDERGQAWRDAGLVDDAGPFDESDESLAALAPVGPEDASWAIVVRPSDYGPAPARRLRSSTACDWSFHRGRHSSRFGCRDCAAGDWRMTLGGYE